MKEIKYFSRTVDHELLAWSQTPDRKTLFFALQKQGFALLCCINPFQGI